MSAVFLDTVGLIAQWDTTDQWHGLADSAYQQIKAQRRAVVTTTFVLLECGNTAARRTFRSEVGALRPALELRNELIAPTEQTGKTPGWPMSVGKQHKPALSIMSHLSSCVA